MSKVILFPIESTSREIECRVELANCILANNDDFIIIIGEQQLIRLVAIILKKVAFFGKHLFAKPKFGDKWLYNKLKKNYSKIFYLHEEGVFPGSEDNWEPIVERAMQPILFDENDTLFLWSNFQKDYFNKYDLKCKTYVTGHPRFDLYKKRLKRHVKYKYLFNSSFSYSNNSQGLDFIFSGNNPSYNFDTKESKSEYFTRYLDQSRNQLALEKAAIDLAFKNPNQLIKFRPHPSENLNHYKTLFSKIENIFVDNSSTINDDIKDSEIIIQIGCTTAIEGYLSGKKVYTLEGTQDSGARISYDLSGKFIFDDNNEVKFINYNKVEKSIIDDHSYKTLDNLDLEKDSLNKISEIIINESQELKNYSYLFLLILLKTINYLVYPVYWLIKIIFYLLKNRLSEIKDFRQRYSVNKNKIFNDTNKIFSFKIISKFLFIIKK